MCYDLLSRGGGRIIKNYTYLYQPKRRLNYLFSNKDKRFFQSCTLRVCRYSRNLRSAKKELDKLEANFFLAPQKVVKEPAQRKTTLKWNSDGELSAVDMARILDRLTKPELSQCDLDDSLSYETMKEASHNDPLPSSAWLP